ncbi:MAG: Asp-tRNA(Asn)/Glu-tRNA(Gln) amidotransferase subunit GatC [Candidatus Pacebacteria bacterium]|nr:Asp-tRNA(Asn)/Glu-tRNA(Gln) amidotransferase subunit GatC [Candidatus Paceibacterota bacterium]
MSKLEKKDLEHLAKLSRFDIRPDQEERFLGDLGKILDYFNDLNSVDTSKVSPIFSGGDLKNVMREDETLPDNLDNILCVSEFPEKERGLLKVPPIFE